MNRNDSLVAFAAIALVCGGLMALAPAPTGWALLVVGFGAAGASLRARYRRAWPRIRGRR